MIMILILLLIVGALVSLYLYKGKPNLFIFRLIEKVFGEEKEGR